MNPLLKQIERKEKFFMFKHKDKQFDILIKPFSTEQSQDIFNTLQNSIYHLKRFILQNQESWSLQHIRIGTNQAELDWKEGKNYYFAIYYQNKVVGSTFLTEINQTHRFANFGCWFAREVLGTKISILSSLYTLLLGFELGLVRIEMVIDINNIASFNAIKRLPVLYEGLMRNRLSIGNESFDAHLFSITNNEVNIINDWINNIIKASIA